MPTCNTLIMENWAVVAEEETWRKMTEKDREAVVVAGVVKTRLMHLVDYCKH